MIERIVAVVVEQRFGQSDLLISAPRISGCDQELNNMFDVTCWVSVGWQ